MIDPHNPYAMPNAYDVSNIMTGYQRDEQLAESEKLKLGEQKRLLSEAELARNIKAEAVKGLAQATAPQAPTPTAPVAPQPQAESGSTAFWQGQAAAAQEPPPATPVQQYRAAQAEYSNISKQMQEYGTISKALKEKGLVDQAEQYDTKLLDLETKAQTAKKGFLENAVKTLDLAGSLANGYIQAVDENPANSDAAWARFAMQAKL